MLLQVAGLQLSEIHRQPNQHYLFKVNSGNIGMMCEIWQFVKSEQFCDNEVVLVPLLLTLNKSHTSTSTFLEQVLCGTTVNSFFSV